MDNYYVIGDIHGRADMLLRALREWDSDTERLILLGDYIDYGPNSLQTGREGRSLVNRYGAIALAGSHDKHFVQLIKGEELTVGKGGKWNGHGKEETFKSFLGDDYVGHENFDYHQLLMQERHGRSIEFLDSLSLFYETDTFVFAHSGINLQDDNWRATMQEQPNTSRGDFIRTANRTGKIIVFGHSRTGVIRGMKKGMSKSELHSMPFLDDRAWIDPSGTKLGLDGGNVFGGVLHAAHLNDDLSEARIVTVNQANDITFTDLEVNQEYKRFIV